MWLTGRQQFLRLILVPAGKMIYVLIFQIGGGGGGEGFLGIIGVGVPPGSPNPDPILGQKMSFSHPFSDLASKKLYFIIT